MAGKKTTKKKGQGTNAEAQALCEQHSVRRLFINSKGEYFTERTYALASEGGDKTKVTVYDADADEAKKDTEEGAGEYTGDDNKEGEVKNGVEDGKTESE